MKIKILLLPMLIGMHLAHSQQNTYLDALRLADIYNDYDSLDADIFIKDTSKHQKKFIEIILKYNPNYEDFKKNPFFKNGYLAASSNLNGFDREKIKLLNDLFYSDSILNNFSNTISESLSNDGIGDWESLVIKGTTEFLTKRFTSEAIYFGINKVFRKYEKDTVTYKYMRQYFPKSMGLVDDIRNDKLGIYAADLTLLKSVVKVDLEEMPLNILQDENYGSVLKIGYTIIKGVKQVNSVYSIINEIGAAIIKEPKDEFGKGISLLTMLSNALKNKETESEIWVNPIETLRFTGKDEKNELVARYFYGLLYEQLKREKVQFNYYEEENTLKFVRDVQPIMELIPKFTELKINKDFKKTDVDSLLNYVSHFLVSIRDFMSNEKFWYLHKTPSEKLKTFNTFFEIVEPFFKQDYQRGITNIYLNVKNEIDISKYREINFLYELATIENSDEMEKLLDSYALPIGSSSIKRQSKFNISLNGYVGLTGGIERAFTKTGNADKWNIGLTAPIGIAFSFGCGKLNSGSFSVFVSVIDLGTMVNTRLRDKEIEEEKLKITQFLSPGIGAYYNIPKTPLSIGLQYNYIPNLRSSSNEDKINVNRLNLSLLVDIPFFNLYNGMKKNK